MFNTIQVRYWHLQKYSDLPYEHGQIFDFSMRKRNYIINIIINKGYSVMLKPYDDNLTIWVDKGRFGQR